MRYATLPIGLVSLIVAVAGALTYSAAPDADDGNAKSPQAQEAPPADTSSASGKKDAVHKEARPSAEDVNPQDPTQPSAALRALLGPKQNAPGRAATVARMPVLGLRAIVVVPEKPAAAIIAVDQSLHRVEAGTEITTLGPTGPLVIRIESVDADGVRVRMDGVRQTFQLK